MKRALNSIKRALYSIKRALCSTKRALQSMKTALHSIKRALCSTKSVLRSARSAWLDAGMKMMRQQPACNVCKAPCILRKEPYILWKEPFGYRHENDAAAAGAQCTQSTLYFTKDALYSMERTIYFTKSALCSTRRACLDTGTKTTQHKPARNGHNAPCIERKEPYILWKEPCIL